MSLTLSTVALFIVLFVLVEVAFHQIFKPMSSLDFVTNADYFRHFEQQQLLCREMQILSAVLIGAATGLLHCWWNGESFVPVLATLGMVEFAWLGMMYVLRPQKEQRYYDMLNLTLACLAAVCVGLFFCLSLGAASAPLLVAGGVGTLAWMLLTPL